MSLYEWNMTLWGTSQTRNRLDATGRGIYRELLDWCYAQGSIPDDHESMARYCGATLEQFEAAWPHIKSHFSRARLKQNSLENRIANVQRKQYFAFISQQRAHGVRSGKKRVKATSTESITSAGLVEPTLAASGNQEEKRREEKRREEIIKEDTGQLQQIVDSAKTAQPDRSKLYGKFAEFIAPYPNQTRLESGMRAWIVLVDRDEITDETYPDVIAGRDRWIESREWADEDGKYVPQSKVFLLGNEKHNGRLWKDRPQPSAESKANRRMKQSGDGTDAYALFVPSRGGPA